MTESTIRQKASLWLAIVFSAEARRAQRKKKLNKDVGLNSDQQKQVSAILDQAQGDYKVVHTVMDPQIEAVRQKTREKIRAVLTEDQKPKFAEFLRKMDEERKRNDGK